MNLFSPGSNLDYIYWFPRSKGKERYILKSQASEKKNFEKVGDGDTGNLVEWKTSFEGGHLLL